MHHVSAKFVPCLLSEDDVSTQPVNRVNADENFSNVATKALSLQWV
jgi:hypothetical protein